MNMTSHRCFLPRRGGATPTTVPWSHRAAPAGDTEGPAPSAASGAIDTSRPTSVAGVRFASAVAARRSSCAARRQHGSALGPCSGSAPATGGERRGAATGARGAPRLDDRLGKLCVLRVELPVALPIDGEHLLCTGRGG